MIRGYTDEEAEAIKIALEAIRKVSLEPTDLISSSHLIEILFCIQKASYSGIELMHFVKAEEMVREAVERKLDTLPEHLLEHILKGDYK